MTIFLIKVIALICMVIDHIGEFIPQTPMWFRYIGRLAIPMFFFCSVWGFYYTSNREKYLLRLYICGLIMSLGNIVLSVVYNRAISNNIFTTICWGCIVIWIFETAQGYKQIITRIILLMAHQIIAFGLCALLAEFLCIPHSVDTYMLYYGYGALFGSVIFTEGGFLFVFCFAMMYLFKDKPVRLTILLVVFSFIITLICRRTYYMRGAVDYLFPFDRYQWMMMFAIPFFYFYNGKKGKSFKWLFYLFYPLHIWGLFVIGSSFG